MKQTIRHIFGSTFTVATIFLAAGCSEYNPEEFNGNLTKEEYEKISEYTQNFTLRYGKMDPDHDWGFGELAPKGSKGVKGTRTANTDGKFWISNGYDNIPPADTKNYEAAVTEIFRDETKWKEYQVTGIDFTDFFVQQVHKGATDVCTYTIYKDGNGTTHEVYGPDHMNQLVCQKKDGTVEHVNNFNDAEFNHGNWNQEVWNGQGGEHGYNDQNNLYKDAIILMQNSGTDAFGWSNTNDEGYYYMDAYMIIEYPKNSGYYYVGFDYYRRNDGVLCETYYTKLNVIKEKQESYNNNYAGWSEEQRKQAEEEIARLQAEADKYKDCYKNGDKFVDRDYNYDDWIVRITPAKKQSTTPDITTETARVMCEDLGSTNDFDFNDLVFDVYYTYKEDAAGNKSNIQAHITLQAVGGTLPIYIGAQTTSDSTKELHYRMTNTNAKNPINVGAGTTCAPVTFTMSATSTNANDLDICVGSSDNKATDFIILPSSGNSNLAPQKICVPTTVRWLKESQQIEWGYTKFKDWVNSQKTNHFWNDGINESYLY